jgi:hypothetical protein
LTDGRVPPGPPGKERITVRTRGLLGFGVLGLLEGTVQISHAYLDPHAEHLEYCP